MKEKALVFLAGTLTVVFLVEGLLRLRKRELLLFENQITRQVSRRPNPCLSKLDNSLGWRTDSYQSAWVPGKREPQLLTYVSTLANGLRSNGPGKDILKQPGFLALGDSLTFGDEVSDSETWPSYLQAKLGQPVFNGGACSYGIDQSYLRFLELEHILDLKGVILSITPVGVARNERKFMLTPFFKKLIPKPYFTLEQGQLTYFKAESLDPNYNYNGLDSIRKILGYSYFFDFVFRKLANDWWWAIVPKEEYAPHLKTSFNGETITCVLLENLGSRIKSKRRFGIVLLQDYFKSEARLGSFEKIRSCAESSGFLIVDAREHLYQIGRVDPQKYHSFWVRKNGGHLSAAGNREVAAYVFDSISRSPLKNQR